MVKFVVSMLNLESALVGSQENLDIDDITLQLTLSVLDKNSFAHKVLQQPAAQITYRLPRFIRDCARGLASTKNASVQQALLVLIDTATAAIESKESLCLWNADAEDLIEQQEFFVDEPVKPVKSEFVK
ncbi:hypothetical protein GF342_05370 [Candidatus Woesearchaeota archaeon]|nr:hypothetical protein [Candidatus Woesearchaeota archaeon]